MFISRSKALVGTGISLAASTIAGCATYGNPPAAPAADAMRPASANSTASNAPRALRLRPAKPAAPGVRLKVSTAATDPP